MKYEHEKIIAQAHDNLVAKREVAKATAAQVRVAESNVQTYQQSLEMAEQSLEELQEAEKRAYGEFQHAADLYRNATTLVADL